MVCILPAFAHISNFVFILGTMRICLSMSDLTLFLFFGAIHIHLCLLVCVLRFLFAHSLCLNVGPIATFLLVHGACMMCQLLLLACVILAYWHVLPVLGVEPVQVFAIGTAMHAFLPSYLSVVLVLATNAVSSSACPKSASSLLLLTLPQPC